jgi:hypothetical protein
VVIFPPAVLLVAIACDALTTAWAETAGQSRALPILGYAAAATILASLSVQPATDIANWLRLQTGVFSPEKYYAQFTLGQYSAADQIAAAHYIQAHTSSGDRIAVFGYEAPVVYLSGRANATRFGYALPLVGVQSSPAAKARYRREFLSGLTQRPVYIIVGLLLLNQSDPAKVFPEFADVLARDYRLDQTFGPVHLYRARID